MNFGEMYPIFGKLSAEWSTPSDLSQPEKPFLFLASGTENDGSALQVIVSDFSSNTFGVVKSRVELEDMRDDIGIGGSWSEFVDYINTSLKSSDVKLILEGLPKTGGAPRAKLVAQKAKGMPRISIPLPKLVDGAAGEAMSKLSLELYKEYKGVKTSLTEEQVSKYQLTKDVAAEQEKNELLQKQLDMVLNSRKRKSLKRNDMDNSDSTSDVVSQDASVKQAAHSPISTKVNNRVVPAHRRTKVRGVFLEDTEEETKN